jgi:hypothetical protein
MVLVKLIHLITTEGKMQTIIILNFKLRNVTIMPAKLLEHFFRAAILCSQIIM